MSTANHRCTSCRKPVHVRGSMCKTCRAVSGTSARDVTPLRDVGPREPPCAVYVRTHDVRAEGDPWFPEGHDREANADLREIARTICDGCELSAGCAAVRRKRDVGIWAGREWERPGNERHAPLRGVA